MNVTSRGREALWLQSNTTVRILQRCKISPTEPDNSKLAQRPNPLVLKACQIKPWTYVVRLLHCLLAPSRWPWDVTLQIWNM